MQYFDLRSACLCGHLVYLHKSEVGKCLAMTGKRRGKTRSVAIPCLCNKVNGR